MTHSTCQRIWEEWSKWCGWPNLIPYTRPRPASKKKNCTSKRHNQGNITDSWLSQQKQARCIKKSAWKSLGLMDTLQQYRRVSPSTHILHDIGLLRSAKVCVSSKYYKVLLLKVKKVLINTFSRSYIQTQQQKLQGSNKIVRWQGDLQQWQIH